MIDKSKEYHERSFGEQSIFDFKETYNLIHEECDHLRLDLMQIPLLAALLCLNSRLKYIDARLESMDDTLGHMS